MNNAQFTDRALSFPGAVSHPRFRRTAFKVTGRKIFVTLDEAAGSANMMLAPDEQKVFCAIDKSIYPVPDKWGLNGATTFEIKHLKDGFQRQPPPRRPRDGMQVSVIFGEPYHHPWQVQQP